MRFHRQTHADASRQNALPPVHISKHWYQWVSIAICCAYCKTKNSTRNYNESAQNKHQLWWTGDNETGEQSHNKQKSETQFLEGEATAFLLHALHHKWNVNIREILYIYIYIADTFGVQSKRYNILQQFVFFFLFVFHFCLFLLLFVMFSWVRINFE